ncbi:unnamed protein product [Ectocarpus sp. CCAP 1310/34]|nr:unnamed protein product [Ectocarpus sp. CCAP 1310/34]
MCFLPYFASGDFPRINPSLQSSVLACGVLTRRVQHSLPAVPAVVSLLPRAVLTDVVFPNISTPPASWATLSAMVVARCSLPLCITAAGTVSIHTSRHYHRLGILTATLSQRGGELHLGTPPAYYLLCPGSPARDSLGRFRPRPGSRPRGGQAKALDLEYTSSSTAEESDSAMSTLPPSPLSDPRVTAAHDPIAGSTDGAQVKSAPPPPPTVPPSLPASAHNGVAAAATTDGTRGENTVSAKYAREGRVEKTTPGLVEKLKPPPKSTEKKAERAHVRDEFSFLANKERQLVARQDRWAVTPDTWRSWERLRLIVNLGYTSVGSLCQNQRYVYQEVENWINGSPKSQFRRSRTHFLRKELASGGGGATEGAAVVCATRPAAATPLTDSTGHASTKMLLPRSLPCARSSSTKKDGGRARKSSGANANARSNRDGPQDGSGATVVKPTGCAKFNNRNGDAKRGRSVAAPQQEDVGGRRSCASTGKARRKIQGRARGHADASAGAGKKKNMGPATERAATTIATTKVTLTERERRVRSESEDRGAKKHVSSAENGRQPRIASSTLKATISRRKRRIFESDDEEEHAVHATTVNKVVRKGGDKRVCVTAGASKVGNGGMGRRPFQ